MQLLQNSKSYLERLTGEGLYEIRILMNNNFKKSYSLLFKNWEEWEKIRKGVVQYNKGGNVFFTLNPVLDALTGREAYGSSFKTAAKGDSISDKDIKCRRWLLIDLDPKRPTGISASDEEKEFAWAKVAEVKAYMTKIGFVDPVICDSGNGYHLLYRISLPNNEASTKLVKECLAVIAGTFDDEHVDVDKSVFNASRIVKFYGTVARKGRDDQENGRPHRCSGFVSFPEMAELRVNDTALLEKLAGTHFSNENTSTNVADEESFNKSVEFIHNFVEKHGLIVSEEPVPSGDGVKFFFTEGCPFDSSHKGKDAYLHVKSNGARIFKCSHNSDADKGWKEFMRLFEPEYKTYEERQKDSENVLKEAERFLSSETGSKAKPNVPQNGPQLAPAGSNVHDVIDRLEKDKKGNVKHTILNNLLVLRHDSKLKDLFGYDTFYARQMNMKAKEPWSDADDSYMRMRLQTAYGLGRKDDYENAIALREKETKFHSVQALLEEKEWDGLPRLETALIDYLGAADTPYTRYVSKLMFVAAVKRAYEPGCKYDIMPVLVGGQGCGKSTFCRRMALQDIFFTDSVRGIGSKEAIEQITGAWIVEWGEMSAMRRAKDCESVKLFISQSEDKVRFAYSRRTTVKPRGCVFVGTSNELDGFLSDSTGNRRFLPVLCADGKKSLWDEGVGYEFEQMMLEAVQLYRKDFPLYVPYELMRDAAEYQDAFMEEDYRTGLIVNWLLANPDTEMVCIKMLWDKAIDTKGVLPTRKDSREIGQLLRKSGIALPEGKVSFEEYGPQKGWKVDRNSLK